MVIRKKSFGQWWSLEPRDTFLRVAVSKVSGLETLNIAKKWLIKIYILVIQPFLFVVYASKKQPKDVGKCQKLEKNSSQKWWRHFFIKFQQNVQILKSRVSVVNFKSGVSVSEVFLWSLGLGLVSKF